MGALVESLLLQELFKHKAQRFLDFDIYFWRTKSRAEVDFIAYKNKNYFMPIESKYRQQQKPSITRSFRSFLQAYQPVHGVVITKSFIGEAIFENTRVHFIPLEKLDRLFPLLNDALALSF